MTLPKPISDAIYLLESTTADSALKVGNREHRLYESDVSEARAALEAAILAAIKPVPSVADLPQGWSHGSHSYEVHYSGGGRPEHATFTLTDWTGNVTRYVPEPAPVEPPTDAEVEAVYYLPDEVMEQAFALMRRARATEALARPWNGGPTIKALMQGVEDAASEWGKCVGDYNAACLASPPPSEPMALEPVRKAGHKCELAYGALRKAIKALANHGTSTEAAIDQAIADSGVAETDCRLPIAERVSNIIGEMKQWRHAYAESEAAMARLRERVQNEARENACEDYAAGLIRAVDLIDEAQQDKEAKR